MPLDGDFVPLISVISLEFKVSRALSASYRMGSTEDNSAMAISY